MTSFNAFTEGYVIHALGTPAWLADIKKEVAEMEEDNWTLREMSEELKRMVRSNFESYIQATSKYQDFVNGLAAVWITAILEDVDFDLIVKTEREATFLVEPSYTTSVMYDHIARRVATIVRQSAPDQDAATAKRLKAEAKEMMYKWLDMRGAKPHHPDTRLARDLFNAASNCVTWLVMVAEVAAR